jgi:hypothetical protein
MNTNTAWICVSLVVTAAIIALTAVAIVNPSVLANVNLGHIVVTILMALQYWKVHQVVTDNRASNKEMSKTASTTIATVIEATSEHDEKDKK